MKIRDSIFISYSHADKVWYDRFVEQLCGCNVRSWSDEQIIEGSDWNACIRAEIAQARALLLVSPAFVSSEFIRKEELPLLMAARSEGLVVKWVIIRSTPAASIPDELHQLQVFKTQGIAYKALSELSKGEAESEISSICNHLIEESKRYPGIPRHRFLHQVDEAVRGLGYDVTEEIATGDFSIVYKAEEPGDKVVVKALVNLPMENWSDAWLDKFEPHLEKARQLKSAAFIALRRWVLDSEPRLLITDFCDGRDLKRVCQAAPMAVDQVRYIIQIIAAALAEYHQKGLVFGNIRPSDVLLEGDGRHLFPRLAAYRFAQLVFHWEQLCSNFLMTRERFTYLVPEQFGNEQISEKSDQYSLGLLAIEMLQGHAPVEVRHLNDLDRKKRFFGNPARFGGKWLKRSPLLSEIILKMLEPDPQQRWSSMAQIAMALGDGASIDANNRQLAKNSYLRLTKNPNDFYERFYNRLLNRRRRLKALFPNDHDWERQHRKIDAAVCNLLNFSSELAATEPTILTLLAQRHKALGLIGKDFDAFRDAFLDTLADFNEGDEETRGAWMASFAPGIEYMKKQAVTAGSTRATKKARR